MAFNFFIICLFFTRCFIYLNEQNSKSGKCTKEDPCDYLSDVFNVSLPNSSEIHILDNSIYANQTQIFTDLIYLCAKNKIKLFGQNQTINFLNSPFEFSNEHTLYLENFTFFSIESLLLQSNNSKIYFEATTFSHFKSQIMNVANSNIGLKSCLFIHNIVKNYNLLKIYKSDIYFTNCSFQSFSQFPQFRHPIIYLNVSKSLFQLCNFTGNYINSAFFKSSNSESSFINCFLNKNGGNFFFKCISQSTSVFNNCEFIENSCLLFHIIYSNFSMKNASISHNCMPDPFFLFYKSHSVFFRSNFLYNSCGPILNSSNSEIELMECNFRNNISPTDLISIDSGKISINSSLWINTTTAYGSSISSNMAAFYISNSTFNYSYSRICGASIHARDTEFKSISNFFYNSKSLQKGLSICLIDCQHNTFKINRTTFKNDQNEIFFSIYSDQCTGTIQDSFFSRAIDDEIPISLHENCFNCSFQQISKDKIETEIIDYSVFIDTVDDAYRNIKIPLMFIMIFAIICTLFFRRNVRICFHRITRKRHN